MAHNRTPTSQPPKAAVSGANDPKIARSRPSVGAPTKLAEVIYARIIHAIESGECAPGSRLPSELALASMLGASRPVVRDALAWLREDGIVTSRKGSGTYVHRLPPRQEVLKPLMSLADTRQCLEFRLAIEAETAYLAARDGSTASHVAINRVLSKLEHSLKRNRLAIDLDFDFHAVIARASGNAYLVNALTAAKVSITDGMSVIRTTSLRDPAARLRIVHQQHCAVVNAILARQPENAKEAMRAHLTHVLVETMHGTSRPPKR